MLLRSERDQLWRGWDLNPQPTAYESAAPPLSYLAMRRLVYYKARTLSIEKKQKTY